MSILTTKVLETYCQNQAKSWSYKMSFASGRMPDMDDRCASLVRTDKRDHTVIGFDRLVFRVLSRGVGNKIDDAEKIAEDIRNLFHNKTNYMINDIYVTSSWCQFGPRQVVITDPQSRFNFTADYVFIASNE